ncbi:MAG: PrsW family intramembrane metalloprotease [Ruminococcaceae bacterium]|nr:PrsW family intramembrane metalloprotease [Oscillospiraceae bacterium]
MLLILAAVLPAAFLMVKVYKSDRVEREPAWLVISLVLLGMISTALAGAAEQLGDRILTSFLEEGSLGYNALFFFLVVGPAEEGFKYAVLRWRTWRNPEFNCQYDGMVYAVFVALGFALWENIGYVLMFGIQTAVARALTAVPGHACFGVFMGVWYGIAKRYDLYGEVDRSRRARRLCVCIPALLHGCYDFIASLESEVFVLVFLAFIVAMFLTALRIVKRLSARDQYM